MRVIATLATANRNRSSRVCFRLMSPHLTNASEESGATASLACWQEPINLSVYDLAAARAGHDNLRFMGPRAGAET